MKKKFLIYEICNESGAIAVITAVMISMLLGFVALSIDVGHLAVTKNELQNAADAGALAGASMLYSPDGEIIQASCNKFAVRTATLNKSEKKSVEVNWSGGNNGDVQRGHWSFTTRTFTPVDSTVVTPLDGRTADDLDVDTGFVNAVQVTARRQTTPIASFFAGILGFDGFQQSATATAWLGFAGNFKPGDFDLPIALCEEFLGQPYQCGVAVLYEKGENAMWTNLDQPDRNTDGTYPDSCTSANASDVKDLIDTGNTEELFIGGNMGVINGVLDGSALGTLIDKWKDNNNGTDKLWTVTVPVISCIDDDSGQDENTCAELTGGVELELVWISDKENKDAYKLIPDIYYAADGVTELFNVNNTQLVDDGSDQYYIDKWNAFATALGLLDENGDPEPLQKNGVYFKASCEPAETSGGPGGPNYGVFAKLPVLVD